MLFGVLYEFCGPKKQRSHKQTLEDDNEFYLPNDKWIAWNFLYPTALRKSFCFKTADQLSNVNLWLSWWLCSFISFAGPFWSAFEADFCCTWKPQENKSLKDDAWSFLFFFLERLYTHEDSWAPFFWLVDLIQWMIWPNKMSLGNTDDAPRRSEMNWGTQIRQTH